MHTSRKEKVSAGAAEEIRFDFLVSPDGSDSMGTRNDTVTGKPCVSWPEKLIDKSLTPYPEELHTTTGELHKLNTAARVAQPLEGCTSCTQPYELHTTAGELHELRTAARVAHNHWRVARVAHNRTSCTQPLKSCTSCTQPHELQTAARVAHSRMSCTQPLENCTSCTQPHDDHVFCRYCVTATVIVAGVVGGSLRSCNISSSSLFFFYDRLKAA